MKVRLGYVASPLTLDKVTYSHTMTYKTYSNLSSSEAQRKLKEIVNRNLFIFSQVLDYNFINGVHFYRIVLFVDRLVD